MLAPLPSQDASSTKGDTWDRGKEIPILTHQEEPMHKPRLFVGALVLTAVLLNGCANEAVAPEDDLAALISFLRGGGGPNPRPQTWVDGELFDGVVTQATFDPASDPFDKLYAGGNGFKNGVGLISESKPGDQDYNGGRWHLNVLKAGVDPDKYANADSDDDLDLNDFESTATFFECPLLPKRGGS